jgi:hypothetical protein
MLNLRKASPVMLLGAALASALAGCSTGWQTVREDWTPISKTANVETGNQRKTEKNKQFEIKTISLLNGNYFADVTQKLSQETFDEVKYGNVVKYNKILSERNETIIPLGTIAGSIGGVGAGLALNQESDEEGTIILGMALGGLCGFLLGAVFDNGPAGMKTRESRTRSTGETKTVLEDERIFKDMIKSSVSENPASGIKVIVDGSNYIANSQGKVNLSDIVELKYPNYFCRQSNFSGKGMENRIRSIPLVTGLNPKTLDTLMQKLVGEADPVKITVKLQTNEPSTYDWNVANWDGTAILNGYKLSDDDIYKVLQDFIDKDINSRIGQIRFDLKDLVSRTPIDSATFSYETNAPSREVLINQYFNEKLKSFADSRIKQYMTGNGQTNVGSSTTLSVYNPSKMHVEFTNPDYRFIKENIYINQDGLIETFLMADKGSKVRIDTTNDGNGKVEESKLKK